VVQGVGLEFKPQYCKKKKKILSGKLEKLEWNLLSRWGCTVVMEENSLIGNIH
jgi:hypothetical protein